MKHIFYTQQRTGHTTLLKLLLLSISLVSSFNLTGCVAKESELVTGLSIELLNYSQDSISVVKINGVPTGAFSYPAKIGETKGGGTLCCSGEISVNKNSVDVTVETNHGSYAIQALVELPLPPPDLRDTLIIHVLPGRKVVLEVTSFATFGRQDLLEAQIKALNLKQEVPFSDLLRTGPNKYIK